MRTDGNLRSALIIDAGRRLLFLFEDSLELLALDAEHQDRQCEHDDPNCRCSDAGYESRAPRQRI